MANSLGMRALHYVALSAPTSDGSAEEQRIEWLKANQNRLNQNFTEINRAVDELYERIYGMEDLLSAVRGEQ